jgi:hypothetical protein
MEAEKEFKTSSLALNVIIHNISILTKKGIDQDGLKWRKG